MTILGVWQPQKGQKRALIFELFLSPFRAPWLKYGIHCDKTDSVGLRKGVKKGSKRGPWPGSELGLPRVRPGFDLAWLRIWAMLGVYF